MTAVTAQAIEEEIAQLDAEIAALEVRRVQLKNRLGGLRSGEARRAGTDSRREKIKAALRASEHERYARNQSSHRAIADQYRVSLRTVGLIYAEMKNDIRATLATRTYRTIDDFDRMIRETADFHQVGWRFVWKIFARQYRPTTIDEFAHILRALKGLPDSDLTLEEIWAGYVGQHRPSLMPLVPRQWIGIEEPPG